MDANNISDAAKAAAADAAAKAQAAAQAGLDASNQKVQEVGPSVVEKIKAYWYVWVGFIAVLVGGWMFFHH